MRGSVVATLVGVLLLGGAAGLFAVQNSSRTTQLSLDLWFAAWQLEQPVSVPALIGGCLLVGALVAAVPLTVRNARLAARIRQLEASAALDQALGKGPAGKEPGTW